MDLREKKTKRNIKNAFLQLRCKKSLERITVIELSNLAEISKATFYLHYKDVYDLSEQLQEEVIQNIIESISHPELCLSDCKTFTEELFFAFHAQQSLIEILFSGTQSQVLPMRIEKQIIDFVKNQYSNINNQTEMLLSYTIYGGYYVYQRYYKKYEINDIINLISNISKIINA